ncbi:hypothetical protein BGZ98_001086 [Dissophora globulifera]|nr:hypothetical protein BGZ98_001086 [Dissophora globulifera]
MATKKAQKDDDRNKSNNPAEEEIDELMDDDEDGDVYDVERVVGHKRERGTLWYHIKWEGYDDSENTWQKSDEIFGLDVVEEYWARYEASGGKRSDLKGSEPKRQVAKRSPAYSKWGQTTTPDNSNANTSSISSSTKKPVKASDSKRQTLSKSLSSPVSKRKEHDTDVSVKRARLSSKPDVNTTVSLRRAGLGNSSSAGTTKTSKEAFNRDTLDNRKGDRSEKVYGEFEDDLDYEDAQDYVDALDHEDDQDDISTGNNATASKNGIQSIDDDDDSDDRSGKKQWKPPSSWKSWEEHVESVNSVERGKGGMIVHLAWKNGEDTTHDLEEIHKRCPQTLIRFYETHLKFTPPDGRRLDRQSYVGGDHTSMEVESTVYEGVSIRSLSPAPSPPGEGIGDFSDADNKTTTTTATMVTSTSTETTTTTTSLSRPSFVMGYRTGCDKCRRREKGHFAHFE